MKRAWRAQSTRLPREIYTAPLPLGRLQRVLFQYGTVAARAVSKAMLTSVTLRWPWH